MLRKALCSVAILALTFGFAMADEIKGKITKISDKKVTVASGKKGADTKEYDIAKDCKVCKMDKKTKVELADGVKNEAFNNIDARKGVQASVNVVDGKVTEIVIQGRKKKETN